MGRKRNPERDKSLQRYIESGGKMTLEELAAAAGVPKARISKWKSEDKWEERLKEAPKKKIHLYYFFLNSISQKM